MPRPPWNWPRNVSATEVSEVANWPRPASTPRRLTRNDCYRPPMALRSLRRAQVRLNVVRRRRPRGDMRTTVGNQPPGG